jgi:hypothetical protein
MVALKTTWRLPHLEALGHRVQHLLQRGRLRAETARQPLVSRTALHTALRTIRGRKALRQR